MRPPMLIKGFQKADAVRPVAGVLPGIGRQGLPARKRPQSVRVDGRYWNPPATERVLAPPAGNALRAVAEAALPHPLAPTDRWTLLKSVTADFGIVSAGLIAAHYVVSAAASLLLRDRGVWILCPALPEHWAALGVLLGTLITLVGHSEGLYRGELEQQPKHEQLLVTKTACLATALLGMAALLSGVPGISLALLAVAAPLNAGGLLGWRSWRRRRASRRNQDPGVYRNVLIVGAGARGRALARHLTSTPAAGRKVCGFIDDHERVLGDVLGRIEDLARVARAEFVDEVIVTIPQEHEAARFAIQQARENHLNVKFVPDLLGFEPQVPIFEQCGGLPILTLHEEPVPAFRLFCKRTFDLAVSAIGLALSAPLLAIIASAIRLDSKGPAFYKAKRIGWKGTQFSCFKFRTMAVDAEARKEELRAKNQREGPLFKLKEDPRITRVGCILRRYSLDELPQLWNVLRGEMSLVGPRPHPLDDYSRYELSHLRRLDVMPGMTGLWQITARQDPSFGRNMALDLEYIRTWSLWKDLRILCKTASAVIKGSGA